MPKLRDVFGNVAICRSIQTGGVTGRGLVSCYRLNGLNDLKVRFFTIACCLMPIAYLIASVRFVLTRCLINLFFFIQANRPLNGSVEGGYARLG